MFFIPNAISTLLHVYYSSLSINKKGSYSHMNHVVFSWFYFLGRYSGQLRLMNGNGSKDIDRDVWIASGLWIFLGHVGPASKLGEVVLKTYSCAKIHRYFSFLWISELGETTNFWGLGLKQAIPTSSFTHLQVFTVQHLRIQKKDWWSLHELDISLR